MIRKGTRIERLTKRVGQFAETGSVIAIHDEFSVEVEGNDGHESIVSRSAALPLAEGQATVAAAQRRGRDRERCGSRCCCRSLDDPFPGARELDDRPASVIGDCLKGSIGVHCHGMSNDLKHGKVASRICVRVGLGEVISLGIGNGDDRLGLALSVAEGSCQFACVRPIRNLGHSSDAAGHLHGVSEPANDLDR